MGKALLDGSVLGREMKAALGRMGFLAGPAEARTPVPGIAVSVDVQDQSRFLLGDTLGRAAHHVILSGGSKASAAPSTPRDSQSRQ